MRTYALFISCAAATLCASPALAEDAPITPLDYSIASATTAMLADDQDDTSPPSESDDSTDENDLSVEVELSLSTGWIEPMMLSTFADRPTSELTASLCRGSVCLYAYDARELSDSSKYETDVGIYFEQDIDTVTLSAELWHESVPGEDAVGLLVAASVPLSDHVAARLSFMGARGGYTENAIQVALPMDFELGERVALEVVPAVGYSDFAGAAGASLTANLVFEITEGASLLGIFKGYATGEQADAHAGVGLRVSF